MKRLIMTLFVLFALYFGVQILFRFQSTGFTNEYTIKDNDKQYLINETYVANTKGESDSYQITITYGGTKYNFALFKNLNKVQKVVKDVKSNGKCIYLVFRDNESYFDITCMQNNVQTYYHNMTKTNNLDNFANSLRQYGYNPNNYKDVSNDYSVGNVSVYRDNVVDNHLVGVQNYRGLYTMNRTIPNRVYNNEIFEKDVYKASISGLIGNYYVVANYENSHSFNTLYVINIKNNAVKEITNTNVKLSFDSYVQGIVENSMYIFDPNNIEQYELDIKSMTLTEVGNEQTKILYYEDGEWIRRNAYDAVRTKLYFGDNTNTIRSTNWDYQIHIGGEKTGITYYYKKDGSSYKVYKSNGNSTIKTYLFKTSNIERIKYIDNYVYFINGDTLYYYSDSTGVRRLLHNNEFKFNADINFYISK